MKIIEKNLNEIFMYEKNPRNNDAAVEYVANSIKEFGFKVPIIVDKNNVIIAGHTRYKASKLLGLERVPCIVADDLTDDQVKAFRLADNKVGEIAEWDDKLLQEELSKIELDMQEFGFEYDDIFQPEPEEDDYEEVEVPPRTQMGEIWQLGRHRLMCGDSTNIRDVEKLMNGNKANLCVTDPPYNIDYEGGTGMKIKNDNLEDKQFYEFLYKAFNCLSKVLKPGGAFYVWYASKEAINFNKALLDNNLIVKEELIWNKNQFTLGRQDYQWKHEPCLYGWKEGGTHYFIDDRTLATVIDDKKVEFEKLKKADAIEMLKEIYNNIETTVIDCDKPTKSELHPTMKPIKLMGKLIKNSSKRNDIVLDLFGGSGSTLIACEQLDRVCYINEYDPHYCDVIIDRWEQATKKTAELILTNA